MQRGREPIPDDGQTHDQNEREEHDANEVIDEVISATVLPHAR